MTAIFTQALLVNMSRIEKRVLGLVCKGAKTSVKPTHD